MVLVHLGEHRVASTGRLGTVGSALDDLPEVDREPQVPPGANRRRGEDGDIGRAPRQDDVWL
jgi:hypothetical protein